MIGCAKKYSLVLGMLGASLCLASCARQESEHLVFAGSKVSIISGYVEPKCRFIQQVSVSSKASSGLGGNPTEDLHNKLRNRASELGGNTVRIESLGLNSISGGAAVGSVYNCPRSQ